MEHADAGHIYLEPMRTRLLAKIKERRRLHDERDARRRRRGGGGLGGGALGSQEVDLERDFIDEAAAPASLADGQSTGWDSLGLLFSGFLFGLQQCWQRSIYLFFAQKKVHIFFLVENSLK